jgi:hypothetical protein
MFDEKHKKALESRVSSLATQSLMALTDDQAEKIRTEMMKGIRELEDTYNSCRIVYEDKRVYKVVKMGYGEKWDKGMTYIYSEIEKIIEDKDWTRCAKIYKIIDKMHDLVDGRI